MTKDKKDKKENKSIKRNNKVQVLSVEVDEDSMKKEQQHTSHRGVIILVVLLLVVAAIGGYFLLFSKQYNDYDVIAKWENSNTTIMQYVAYQDGQLKYNKEGISYIDENGDAIWVESYNMKLPKTVISEEYIAVADMNGNQVYLFNKSGKVNAVEMPYPICDIDVASQGVLAVVLEGEAENYINLYDKNGNIIVENRTTIQNSGYPIDIDISKDGNKLVASYLYLDGADVCNTIAMYNFGEVGQNETDRLVGGFNYENTIYSKVVFLDNDTICAFGDNQITTFSMKEKPSEKSKIELEKEVASIFYNQSYVGIVTGNTDKQANALYSIHVYTTSGREVFNKPLEFTCRDIYATQNEIVVVGDTQCRIYDFTGKKIFTYAFQKNISNVIPANISHKYIIVYDDSTELVQLKHTKEQ